MHRALSGKFALRVVRVIVKEHKARWRRRNRARRARGRVSIVVQARDVIWSLDATHLGRDAVGEMQAESLKDVASTSALTLSVGRASSGEEIEELLDRTSEERGGPPLVLAVDCGSNYASGEVAVWAEKNGVMIMQSLPRVPQHNSWVENGHGEIKDDAELGKGAVLEPLPCARWTLIGGRRDIVDGWYGEQEVPETSAQECAAGLHTSLRRALPSWCRRLARSVQVLNERRARSSRGGWTAAALDAALPRGDDLVSRESFIRTVRRNVELAVAAAPNGRARRCARRNAIVCTLELFGLVRRTRGGRPWSQPISETQP